MFNVLTNEYNGSCSYNGFNGVNNINIGLPSAYLSKLKDFFHNGMILATG